FTPERVESRAALDRAVKEASLRGDRLHIVQTIHLGAADNPTQMKKWAAQVRTAEEAGQALVARLNDEGLDVTFQLERTTDQTAEALLEAADREDAGLIVIGLRRRSPVGKLVLGSVSQNVLLRAECPVLTVKVAE